MDFFSTLFGTSGIASSLLYVCLAAFTGILLGKLQILDVKLGVAGVLFSGILIGHFGAVLDHDILRFVSDFGLILFVYSFGLEMGPRFFSSFKRDGLTLNLFAIGIALGGVGVAYAIYALTDLSPAVVMGILCGGVTNTTSLGAAQQVLMDQGGDFTSSVAQSSMGYALTYPFGVVGLILAMILLRKLFRVDLKEEAKAYSDHLDATETKLQSVEITVSNQNLVGKTIGELRDILDAELAVSRIYRNHDYVLATDDQTIVEGDVIYGVSEQKHIDDLRLKIGDVVIAERQNITGMMDICNVLLTNKHLAGKTIEQVGIYRRYPANITRIYRSGIELLPTLRTTLEFGDTLKIVGKKDALDEIKKELGNSTMELALPNITPVFLGIFLGIILGSIPIFIPGLPAPARLGLAGGTLIVAILLGHKGRIGKMNLYMLPGANMMVREIGIVLFLSSVGLLAGEQFWQTLLHGGWQWMIYGAIITFLPVIVVAIIARWMKVNYLTITGCIAGAMTDSPALEFANSMAPVQAQATAYAAVYPMAMFIRVVLAQLFILTTM